MLMRNYRIEYKNLSAGSDDTEIFQCQAPSIMEAMKVFKEEIGEDDSYTIVSVREFHI